jgi:DNA-binding MarR family transcriptional regulator
MDRDSNLLGALGVALYDAMGAAIADASELAVGDAASLNAVGQSPGCSVSAVATVTGLSHAGAVRVVDRLERMGLVRRGPGVDGRTVGLHLSAAGGRRWRRQTAARAELLDRLFASIDPSVRLHVRTAVETMLAELTVDTEQGERLCRLCDEASCPQDECPVTIAAR